MTPAEVLREAALAAKVDQFRVSGHGLKRMAERNVTRRDIRLAMLSAHTADAEDPVKWRLRGGQDDDGEDLDVVVAFADGVIVVTVY